MNQKSCGIDQAFMTIIKLFGMPRYHQDYRVPGIVVLHWLGPVHEVCMFMLYHHQLHWLGFGLGFGGHRTATTQHTRTRYAMS